MEQSNRVDKKIILQLNIRFALPDDLSAIVEIYNQAISAGNATADLSLLTVENRQQWFGEHSENDYPIYVLERNNHIIGWGSLSPYRKGRAALKETAEISYYLHYDYHGKGFGRKLIEFIIDDCNRLNINNLFAILLEVNRQSIAVLEKIGFEKWGYLPGVANLNGKICGHLIYGRNL